MIDVCLLGTGGMMPLPYRYLTSLMLRYNGKGILVDCGEGTQVALRRRIIFKTLVPSQNFLNHHCTVCS